MASNELQSIVGTLPDDAPRELGALLTVHSMLLDDPTLAEQACELIAQRQYNAEWDLTTQGQLLGEQFSDLTDEYLRERGGDLRQVIEPSLRLMSGLSDFSLPGLDVGAFDPAGLA